MKSPGGKLPASIEFTVEAGHRGRRLDVVAHDHLPQESRSRVQAWIRAGRVRVNGEAAKPSLILRGGERIEIEPAAPPPLKAVPEDLPVEVLYQDEDLIAVNKPAGVVVHSGAGVHAGTLVNRLLHHFDSLSQVGGELRPGIVHRLDRHTSGVLLVARTDTAHRRLAAQFAGRNVEKTYLALVHGRVRADQGRITSPIARDPNRRTRMTTRLSQGRAALTEYRVLKRLPGFTYLEVRIGTGRTHQIRVHLASIGHPVAGDRLYGAPAPAVSQTALGRYFLHAWMIRFDSPSTGRRITVEAPLAEDLKEWLDRLSV